MVVGLAICGLQRLASHEKLYCDVINEKIFPTNYNLVHACTVGKLLLKIKTKFFSEEREEGRKKVVGVTGIILWA